MPVLPLAGATCCCNCCFCLTASASSTDRMIAASVRWMSSNDGRAAGSSAQHEVIKCAHSAGQYAGIGGLRPCVATAYASAKPVAPEGQGSVHEESDKIAPGLRPP